MKNSIFNYLQIFKTVHDSHWITSFHAQTGQGLNLAVNSLQNQNSYNPKYHK